MNTFADQRSARAFQLKPVAAGCAVFLAVLTTSVSAQTAPAPGNAAADAPPVQSVVVSGIRRGIEDAISAKRDSSSIVEAISAEDIGKLPDTSIAESIAPPARSGRPARRWPRPGHQRTRPVAGLRHHPAQRPRTGQHGRQPQRRIRSVSIGTAGRRDRLQNPGRRPDRSGSVRHHRHESGASAGLPWPAPFR